MPLYTISGKFADNHTFRTTLDGETPQAALTTFGNLDGVKDSTHGKVTQVSVIQQGGKSLVKISDEPAKPRKPRTKKTDGAAAAPAAAEAPAAAGAPAPKPSTPAQSSARRR